MQKSTEFGEVRRDPRIPLLTRKSHWNKAMGHFWFTCRQGVIQSGKTEIQAPKKGR
jgi:hypothetical protein